MVKKISELSLATAVDGTELVPIVKGGENVLASLEDLVWPLGGVAVAQVHADAEAAVDAKTQAEEYRDEAAGAAAAVVAIGPDLTAVAAIAPAVVTVAGMEAEILAVPAVAAIAADVSAVAAIDDDIAICADNIADIQAAPDIAAALASISAGGHIYPTKADLTAAAGMVDANGWALVVVDESTSNHAVLYRKEGGGMVAKLDLTAGAPPSFASITGAPGDNAALAAALALLATIASPAFTGNPTAPTQATGNNSTRIATTAFVKAALDALVDAAPGTLDTLNELAAALNDDPNFATTVTNALAAKAPSLNPQLTGDIYLHGRQRSHSTAVATTTLDCSAGNYFTKALAGDLTFAFSNVPAGVYSSTLELSYTSGNPSWPASVAWKGGTEPPWSAGTWLVMFLTSDGGTNFHAAALGPF